jgi:hypothetical protein
MSHHAYGVTRYDKLNCTRKQVRFSLKKISCKSIADKKKQFGCRIVETRCIAALRGGGGAQ